MDIQQNKIFNYTQIYDYLKNLKLTDYLSNKRDSIHKQIFDDTINLLISEVNNPDTTVKIAQYIQSVIDKYNIYGAMPDEKMTVEYISGKRDNYCIEIKPFSTDNFKFIEYKNKVWYMPSNVSIVYTNSLVKSKNGNYIRLIIGPISLSEIWDNNYILKRNINNSIKSNDSSYVIEYIDYVNGTVTLFDKVNFKSINVDLDYIQNINNFNYIQTYNEMFINKRKNNK